MTMSKERARKRNIIFSSFIMCCLGASLLASAMATENWFEADCEMTNDTTSTATGRINFGLFSGKRSLIILQSPQTHHLKVVCMDGLCMYSCGKNKDLRKEQMSSVMDGTSDSFDVTKDCERVTKLLPRRTNVPTFFLVPNVNKDDEDMSQDPLSSPSFLSDFSSAFLKKWSSFIEANRKQFLEENEADRLTPPSPEMEEMLLTRSSVDPDQLEFMNYGLWVGTITSLVLGLAFAVVGALFAVINTATTPVEAITGVPGLYVWNGLAGVSNLVCVILWAVQFHLHLSSNVLLYDAVNGWTTEGQEVFGYSFWLVVVAIIVHAANIVIIFVGTYEPRVKEQLEAPETKAGNIMLY